MQWIRKCTAYPIYVPNVCILQGKTHGVWVLAAGQLGLINNFLTSYTLWFSSFEACYAVCVREI